MELVLFKCWSNISRISRGKGFGIEQKGVWWNVCCSNAGIIQVGAIVAGVLGLSNSMG